jgi:hypothetical protein
MPTLKRKRNRFGRPYENMKVYRPEGTLYATSRRMYLQLAIDRAWHNFALEFGRVPVQERVVVEVIGITAGWDVTVFELPEEAE